MIDVAGLLSNFVALEPMSIITLLLIIGVSYKYNQLISSLRSLHIQNSECLDGLQVRVVDVEKELIAIRVRDKTIESFISELRENMSEVYAKLEEVRVELARRN